MKEKKDIPVIEGILLDEDGNPINTSRDSQSSPRLPWGLIIILAILIPIVFIAGSFVLGIFLVVFAVASLIRVFTRGLSRF